MTEPINEQLRARADSRTARGADTVWKAAQAEARRHRHARFVIAASAAAAVVIAFGYVAQRGPDNNSQTDVGAPAADVTTSVSSDDTPAPDSAGADVSGIDLVRIEADSTSPEGQTEVVITFDADLPDNTVQLLDAVSDRPSPGIGYTTQASTDDVGGVQVCGDSHFFPPPGNRTVDLLIPASWFAPGAEIDAGGVDFAPDAIAGAKIITCEPRNGVVQISIWGAASARPEDVAVTVESNAIRVAVTPDPVEFDLRAATVVRVDPPPSPGSTEPVGRCYQFSAAGAEPTRVACLFGSGPNLWEWNSEIYVLKWGGSISRAGQEPIARDPQTGLAIAKFDDSIATAEELLLACVDRALVEAVSDITGPDAPPMYFSRCTGDYALVGVNHLDYLERERALVMESDSNGNWEFIAEIDFGNPDRIERCTSLPDDLLQSLGDLCTTLG